MKYENANTVDDAVYFRTVEEPVARFLEIKLNGLEEEYNIELFL